MSQQFTVEYDGEVIYKREPMMKFIRVLDRYKVGQVVLFRNAKLLDGPGVFSEPPMRGRVLRTPQQDDSAFYTVEPALGVPTEAWIREADIVGTIPPTQDLQALEAWLETD